MGFRILTRQAAQRAKDGVYHQFLQCLEHGGCLIKVFWQSLQKSLRLSLVWSLDLACLRLKGSKHIVLAHDHQGLSILNICETNQGKKIPAWIIVWNLTTVLVWLFQTTHLAETLRLPVFGLHGWCVLRNGQFSHWRRQCESYASCS